MEDSEHAKKKLQNTPNRYIMKVQRIYCSRELKKHERRKEKPNNRSEMECKAEISSEIKETI